MCKIFLFVLLFILKGGNFIKNNLYFNTGELSIVIKELNVNDKRNKNEFYYGRSRKGSRKSLMYNYLIYENR